MKASPEVAIVRAWHEALNLGDVDGLVALSSEDVEVGGPRGSGRGGTLLREWFSRAGLSLEPRQVFHRGHLVVVEQNAEWRSPGGDAITGSQVLASVFRVQDERVAGVIRYPDLGSALAASGLSEADRV